MMEPEEEPEHRVARLIEELLVAAGEDRTGIQTVIRKENILIVATTEEFLLNVNVEQL